MKQCYEIAAQYCGLQRQPEALSVHREVKGYYRNWMY